MIPPGLIAIKSTPACGRFGFNEVTPAVRFSVNKALVKHSTTLEGARRSGDLDDSPGDQRALVAQDGAVSGEDFTPAVRGSIVPK
jgi:hypothetical protein